MALTANEALIIDNSTPDLQRTELGTEVKSIQDINAYNEIVITKAVTADATSGLAVTVPYNMTITDVTVLCTAANASGTMTVKSGANAITDAIACAVDTTLARASTLDDAYTAITTSSTIAVYSNGAADRGIVRIYGIRS